MADGVADEDGFITVTYKKKRRHDDAEEGDDTASGAAATNGRRKKRKKNLELVNFYRFQMREAKRERLAALRQRFEEDKARIAKMKAARKFAGHDQARHGALLSVSTSGRACAVCVLPPTSTRGCSPQMDACRAAPPHNVTSSARWNPAALMCPGLLAASSAASLVRRGARPTDTCGDAWSRTPAVTRGRK